MTDRVVVFLDESGTEAGSTRLLVGAVATLDPEGLTQDVDVARSAIVADSTLWSSDKKRTKFQATGFHHCDDSVTIRDRFVEVLRTLPIRVHVGYAAPEFAGLGTTRLMSIMYSVLITNIIQRYRGLAVELVFETNSSLNSLYGRIAGHAQAEADADSNFKSVVTCVIDGKGTAGLAVTDYCLALVRQGLEAEAGMAQPHEAGMVRRINPQLAHLLDFERALHRRKLDRLL